MPRIISGTHAGRTIAAAPSAKTRPTSDRIREAIFSRLQSWQVISEAKVLDLYAGTGALGFEALSRGATSLQLIEQHAATAKRIQKSAQELGFEQVIVHNRRVSASAVKNILGENFRANLVFADPPYEVSNEELSSVIVALAQIKAFADEATIVIERSSRSEKLALPTDFQAEGVKTHGDTAIYYYSYLDPEITQSAS